MGALFSCLKMGFGVEWWGMVIRMRHTRAHTANRRSHHGLSGPRLSTCAKCGTMHLRHRVCVNCGTYRGREMTNVLVKTEKKAKKATARASK